MKQRGLLNWAGTGIIILTLILAGCSNGQDERASEADQAQPAQQEQSAGGGADANADAAKANEIEAAAEPAMRTIEHAEGEVEIPNNPQRIADISGLTEDLLILNIQPLGTANTDPFDNAQIDPLIKEKLNPSAIPLGYYGGGTINMEAIISLDPDLILTNVRHSAINEELAKIAPTVIVKDNDLSTDWRGRFIHLGEIFERQDDVAAWLEAYDNKAKRLHDEITAKTGDATFGIIETGSYGYRIYADAGVGDILFNDMKLSKVPGTPEGVWGAAVSLEGLTTIDPDHIILLYTDSYMEELENSAIWKSMRAVKQGQVYKITNEVQYAQAFTTLGKDALMDLIGELILNN